jgi:hypothetical protein
MQANDKNLLKASFLGSVFTVVLATFFLYGLRGSTVLGSSSTESTSWQARRYCLTKTKVAGNKPLTACPAGFHMANMAEIVNPSALKYDSTVGFSAPDSGSGPPFDEQGWVRTGLNSWGKGSVATGGGVANCELWTTDAEDAGGTVVKLTGGWGTNVGAVVGAPWTSPTPENVFNPSIIAPWSTNFVPRNNHDNFARSRCSEAYRVWCVQD